VHPAHGAHPEQLCEDSHPQHSVSIDGDIHTVAQVHGARVGQLSPLARAQIAPLANAHRNAQRFHLDGFLLDPYPCLASSSMPALQPQAATGAPPAQNPTGSLRRALRRVRQAHSDRYCVVPISYHHARHVTCPPSEPIVSTGMRGAWHRLSTTQTGPALHTTHALASARVPHAQLAPPLLNVGLAPDGCCAGSEGCCARLSECNRQTPTAAGERDGGGVSVPGPKSAPSEEVL